MTDKKTTSQTSQISEKDKAKWDEIASGTIDFQVDNFLKAFIEEFSGNIEAVMDKAELFKKYRKNATDPDLAENEAHLFLEKCDEPVTVKTLRDFLKDVDLDNNRKMCFLEYALYKWKHSATQFFVGLYTVRPGGSEALDRAIKKYREVLAVKAAREAKIEKLKEESKLPGVKGKTAQSQLNQMLAEDQLAMNKSEISAGAAKRKAEKEAKDDPFTLEQKRVAELKKKEEEEKKKKAEESRARLADRAKAFNPNSSKDVVSSIGKSDTKLQKVTTKVENSSMTRDKIQAQMQKGAQHLNKVDAPSTAPSDAVKEAFRQDRAESKTRDEKQQP
jgi:AraC-like DNA-binding protein